MAEDKHPLIRGLTLTDTTALVIGTVIGSGVFLKTAVMTQDVGTPSLVLLAWVAAGLLSLAGALTYAELGAMLPRAGGEYVYLRHSYGDAAAFLFGWQRFIVAGSASIASLGSGFAIFLATFLPLNAVWAERELRLLGQDLLWQFGPRQLVAVGAIVFLSVVNCLAVAFGGKVQSALTLLKLGGIAFLVLGIFVFSGSADWSHLEAPAGATAWSGFALFGTAMLAALWAFDGWNNMPMAAGEVKDPGRNIPRALVGGMLVVLVVYLLANLAYFYALPLEEVVSSNSTRHRSALPVATKAAITFLGENGGKLVALAFVVSAFGALNGSILSNARVPYAMARDGLFFSHLGELNAGARVPYRAVMVQAVWSSVLAVSGTFDQLTDSLLFASWIFYGLVTSSVFVLRRKRPDLPRPYRTFGYPVVPAVFVLVSAWLVVNTLIEKRVESVTGLVLILIGLPLYLHFRRGQRRARPEGPSEIAALDRALPVLDVSALREGTSARAPVADAMNRACRAHGFFYVVGHGVDPDLCARLEAASRRFFAQDEATKMQWRMALGGRAWRGYFPAGGELTSGRPDWKEGLYFGAELPDDHPLVRARTPIHGRNLFPSLPGFREDVLAYMEALTRLGHTLTEGLALSLGLEASYFARRYTADPLVLFRIFNYPSRPPGPAQAQWGVGEHTDYGLLTMLWQDDVGGLQVKTGGGWVSAPPVPGSFICNIGDMLDRMTGGHYRSTPHRVALNTSGRDRLSMPFFFDPHFEVRVQPVEGLAHAGVPDDQASRWDQASVHAFDGTYGDYLLAKVSKVFPELRREVL